MNFHDYYWQPVSEKYSKSWCHKYCIYISVISMFEMGSLTFILNTIVRQKITFNITLLHTYSMYVKTLVELF